METKRTFKAGCLLYKTNHKVNKNTLDAPKEMFILQIKIISS